MPRLALLALLPALLLPAATPAQGITANNLAANGFDDIPTEYFDIVREELHVFYGHTSHGRQLWDGLLMLRQYDSELYELFDVHHHYEDLGYNGDLHWVQPTRDYLDAHPECRVVMWSWCHGVSDNTPWGIQQYLTAMDELEQDYPGVTFVYMTGHLDGTGPLGNLFERNNQIRAFCAVNGKVLFDFADIETWDPAVNWYPYDDDSCNWCDDWCQTHDCRDCTACAHSHCFNCWRKGQAWWWLMARLAGWNAATATPTPGPGVTLDANWPNPFNPVTNFSFTIDGPAPVRLVVLDSRGHAVREILDTPLTAGRHLAAWDGRDDHGRSLPSGNYFYRLTVGRHVETRKMTLLK